ncbi:MAG: hypothetical protein Q9209_000771 [Squamulea sp. 1 TL-2023]
MIQFDSPQQNGLCFILIARYSVSIYKIPLRSDTFIVGPSIPHDGFTLTNTAYSIGAGSPLAADVILGSGLPILQLEDVDPYVRAVKGSGTEIVLRFKDEKSKLEAEQQWAPLREFIVITYTLGATICTNEDRITPSDSSQSRAPPITSTLLGNIFSKQGNASASGGNLSIDCEPACSIDGSADVFAGIFKLKRKRDGFGISEASIQTVVHSLEATVPFRVILREARQISLEIPLVPERITFLPIEALIPPDDIAVEPLPFRSTTGTKIPNLEFSVALRPRLFFRIEVLGGALVEVGAEAFIDLPKLNVAIDSQPDTGSGQCEVAAPSNPATTILNPTNSAANVLKRQANKGMKQLTHKPLVKYTFFEETFTLPTLCLRDDDMVASTQGSFAIQTATSSDGSTDNTASTTTLATAPTVTGSGYVREADTNMKVLSTSTSRTFLKTSELEAAPLIAPVGVESKASVIYSATAPSLLTSIKAYNHSISISSNLKALSTATAVLAYSHMKSASTDIKVILTQNVKCTTATTCSTIQTGTVTTLATEQKIAASNIIEETTTPTPLVAAITEPAYAYVREVNTKIEAL